MAIAQKWSVLIGSEIRGTENKRRDKPFPVAAQHRVHLSSGTAVLATQLMKH